MFTDPVCGMSIRPYIATSCEYYRGDTYYFCSQRCKSLFDQAPEEYTEQSAYAQRHREAQWMDSVHNHIDNTGRS